MKDYVKRNDCLVQFLKCCCNRIPTELQCSLTHLIPQVLCSHRVSIHQTAFLKNDLQFAPSFMTKTSLLLLALPIQNILHLGNDLEPAFNPTFSFSGPFFIKSASPKSFHAASLTFCVALWIPNAACWSGTTSSSSSGLIGWLCGGT